MVNILAEQTPVLKFQNKRKNSANKTTSSRLRKDDSHSYENVETHPGQNEFKRPVVQNRKDDVPVNAFETEVLADKWAKRVERSAQQDPKDNLLKVKAQDSVTAYSNASDQLKHWDDLNPYK